MGLSLQRAIARAGSARAMTVTQRVRGVVIGSGPVDLARFYGRRRAQGRRGGGCAQSSGALVLHGAQADDLGKAIELDRCAATTAPARAFPAGVAGDTAVLWITDCP